ncbi:2'-5' RNA ligase family protein [Actinoplanes sp. NPDC023714]|uniref:2'-5' RNA ligase family protein n=1 Tax=Actinoplanes sp. NPDC023714 TaxID=3154322 RepID=UPI0033D7E0E1
MFPPPDARRDLASRLDGRRSTPGSPPASAGRSSSQAQSTPGSPPASAGRFSSQARSTPVSGGRSAKWHVTLAFLGDADPAAVTSALAGRSFGGPFRLRIAGSGRFGSVVWAGLAGDVPALADLRARVVSALAGFPVDERDFKPHLTVSYRFSRTLLDDLATYDGPEWETSSFAVVRSAHGEYAQLALLPLTTS